MLDAVLVTTATHRPTLTFYCIMTDYLLSPQVVLLSDRLSLLALAGEALRSLLAPLVWSHVYAPLLPCLMAPDMLQCPTPYLLGLPRAYAGDVDLPTETVRVDLDYGHLWLPPNLVTLDPMSAVYTALMAALAPG